MKHAPSCLIAACLSLAACSSEQQPDGTTPANGAVTSFALSDTGSAAATSERAMSDAMPGKIDPPDAKWQAAKGGGAIYGEPGKQPLITMVCRDGQVAVTRYAPSEEGAKALLAFVGYRGILRLKVTNDGKAWRGALASDDRSWIAVTGGPFYATVAGGGKVVSPASSIAAGVITNCKVKAQKADEDAPLDADAPAA